MPSLFRTLAILGMVSYASYGILAVPAHAQTKYAAPSLIPSNAATTPPVVPPAASSMPPSDATPNPAPADLTPTPPTPPAPAASTAPVITPPTMGTPSDTTPAAPAPTAMHATKHKKTKHASKKTTAAKTSKMAKKGKGDPRVLNAQEHLSNLGYYQGSADGLIGAKTRAALRKFQHDHKLRVDGKLSKATYSAILAADEGNPIPSAAADKPAQTAGVPQPMGVEPPKEVAPPQPDFYATHPDYYGYYNQDFENALLLGPSQTLISRFARVDLTEDSGQQASGMKRYNIMLNGLPLILVDGQPSVVGVSKTFQMGDEDVMIFTTFKDRDPICAYDYNLLILSANGTESRAIHNCTRGYQVKLTKGGLFITFPQTNDGRAVGVGSTYRYEKGDLEKL